jgi:hypothetical protein
LANDLFIPPFPDAERIEAAADSSVDLVLIPTRWVFYDQARFDDFAASYPGTVEYINSDLVVIDPSALRSQIPGEGAAPTAEAGG